MSPTQENPAEESASLTQDMKVDIAIFEARQMGSGASSQRWHDVASTGVETDLKLNSYMEAILDEEDISEYCDYVKMANRIGIPLQYWNADTAEDKLGTDRYVGEVYDR